MLLKTLRAMERQRKAQDGADYNFAEATFSSESVTSIIKINTVKVTEHGGLGALFKFCELIDDLREVLSGGEFPSPREGSTSTTLPLLTSDRNISWIDDGLCFTFANNNFIEMFFNGMEELVMRYAKTVSTPCGDVEITTDDSITESLLDLPRGWETILVRLQFNIWDKTVLPLFFYSMTSSLGGPGSSSRLVIDMIESQLFSTKALEERRVFQEYECPDGTTLPYGRILFEEILVVLGPYPVNIAYGPILQHILYLSVAEHCLDYYNLFFDICNGEHGIQDESNFTGRMGLLSMIGLYILGDTEPTKVHRVNDLFCRSQIPSEFVWKVLPFDALKRLYDCLSEAKIYDDFVVIAFSQNLTLLKDHGLTLVNVESIRKLLAVLQGETTKDGCIAVLEQDCYDRLLQVCTTLLE